MFENLIGKECEFIVSKYGEGLPDFVKGTIEKVYEDFICVKTKKNIQYLAIKFITCIVEL